MRTNHARHAVLTTVSDLGGGWYIDRAKIGAQVEYVAMKLDAPGGHVVDHLMKKFSYKRDAEAWIREQRGAVK